VPLRPRHLWRRRAFTLVELLVVTSILALLLALLMPGLRAARMRARMVAVHSDLRQITLALDAYALSCQDRVPPTRVACGTDVNYQLPIELAQERFLAPAPSAIPQADLRDRFDSRRTYQYVAPGAIYQNGTLFDKPDQPWKPRSKIWVPDDFPTCAEEEGRYYHNFADEPVSPVTYAVWSAGPNPAAKKFPRQMASDVVDDSRFPLPRSYWMTRSLGDGLITHFRARNGMVHQSP